MMIQRECWVAFRVAPNAELVIRIICNLSNETHAYKSDWCGVLFSNQVKCINKRMNGWMPYTVVAYRQKTEEMKKNFNFSALFIIRLSIVSDCYRFITFDLLFSFFSYLISFCCFVRFISFSHNFLLLLFCFVL